MGFFKPSTGVNFAESSLEQAFFDPAENIEYFDHKSYERRFNY